MTEFTLRIDPKTYDLVFDEDGSLATIEGSDVYAQNVAATLGTQLGEFGGHLLGDDPEQDKRIPLEPDHGTDYRRVFGEDISDIRDMVAEEVIREGILQEPNVILITSLDIDFDGRKINARFTGELDGGETLTGSGGDMQWRAQATGA